MHYCTPFDLERRYGLAELATLTDRNKELDGEIDLCVLNAAIKDAQAEIDHCLIHAAYSLPVNPVPHEFIRHACNLTRYYLYDQTRPEYVITDYQETQTWLNQIMTGALKLNLPHSRSPANIYVPVKTLIFTPGVLAKMVL